MSVRVTLTTCLAAWIALGTSLPSPAAGYVRPGSTERVSLPATGMDGPGGASGAFSSVSDDGRFVAFSSDRDDLVAGDTNSLRDAFVRDRLSGTTERVSLTTTGVQAGLPVDLPFGVGVGGDFPTMSGNGRWVAFLSTAQLTPDDKDVASDVFVRDRKLGTTERVSAPSGPPNLIPDVDLGTAGGPSISRSGRYVVFHSDGTQLVTESTAPGDNVYLRDRKTDTTELICCRPGDIGGGGPLTLVAEQNANTQYPSVTSNGRWIAFQSYIDGLVPGDDNGTADVFLYDRRTDKTRWASKGGQTATISGTSEPASVATLGGAISDDGRFVVFSTPRRGYVPQVTTVIAPDAYVYDRQTAHVERISVTSAGAEHLWGGGGIARISGDGRFVTFQTRSRLSQTDRDPPPGINGGVDVYVHDRATGTTEYVSVANSGEASGDCSDGLQTAIAPSITRDGRFISFYSCAGNLDQDDKNDNNDVFVRDRGLPLAVDALRPGASGFAVPAGERSTAIAADLVARVEGHDLPMGSRTVQSRVVVRPASSDLYVQVQIPKGLETSILPTVLQMTINDKVYRVALFASTGSFPFFACTPVCRLAGTVSGGNGTAARAVTLAVPLQVVGLEDGGSFQDMRLLPSLP